MQWQIKAMVVLVMPAVRKVLVVVGSEGRVALVTSAVTNPVKLLLALSAVGDQEYGCSSNVCA